MGLANWYREMELLENPLLQNAWCPGRWINCCTGERCIQVGSISWKGAFRAEGRVGERPWSESCLAVEEQLRGQCGRSRVARRWWEARTSSRKALAFTAYWGPRRQNSELGDTLVVIEKKPEAGVDFDGRLAQGSSSHGEFWICSYCSRIPAYTASQDGIKSRGDGAYCS